MMKTLFLLFVLLSSPLYALFDDGMPFVYKSIVRVMSDNSEFGVNIKPSKKEDGKKYKYDIEIVSFKDLKKQSISFEDDVYYEACYFMINGEYLFLITSPFDDGMLVIIDRKSGEIVKYFLDDFLRKNNLYAEYEMRITTHPMQICELKIWHKNHWNAMGDMVSLLCGAKCDKYLHFLPKKKTIMFENKEVKEVKIEYLKRLESKKEEQIKK